MHRCSENHWGTGSKGWAGEGGGPSGKAQGYSMKWEMRGMAGGYQSLRTMPETEGPPLPACCLMQGHLPVPYSRVTVSVLSQAGSQGTVLPRWSWPSGAKVLVFGGHTSPLGLGVLQQKRLLLP